MADRVIRTPDVLLAAALLVVTLFAVYVLPAHWIEGRAVDALGIALIVASTLPVLVRRRYPVAALLSCVGAQIAYHALDYAHEALLPVAVVLIYTVSVSTSRISTLALVGVTSLALLAAVAQDGPPGAEVISPLGWFVVAAVTGQAVRMHRAFLAAVTERHVAEERLRIARDLHDVLAHNIVVINSHAGVAAHLLDERADDPALAPIARSLHTVADASSGVLAELRRTLDVLRGNEVDARQPTPDLAGLADLATVTKSAGVAVEVETRGEARPLGSAVEVTLYRIAQEALTNVVKHAQARHAHVLLEYGTSDVRLTVTDDGRGADGAAPAGYGLVGMAERAHSVGGELAHGNEPAGGFRVTARVPA